MTKKGYSRIRRASQNKNKSVENVNQSNGDTTLKSTITETLRIVASTNRDRK
jgi:hypothetical protein